MKKLVSTLLALSIILGTLFTGMSVAVSAASFEPAVYEEPVAEEQHYPISSYDSISNYTGYGNHLPKYEKASITKDGVGGSYALKIEGEGKDVESYITVGTGANALAANTEYTLEMKIKRNVNFDEGDYGDNVPYVDFGISTAWKNQMQMAEFVETGVFETFSYTFTPVLDDSGVTGWCHIALHYNLPVGAEIYIDDINIYETGKADINIFNTLEENLGCNLGSFDWMTTSDVDDEAIPGSVYAVNTKDDYGITADYVSIAEGVGVNGSAALQIGATNGKKNFFSQFALEGTKYGGDTSDSFYMGKTVRIAFKAKKVGTVSDFKFLFYKTGKWIQHTVLATELTDDWVRYEADITFTSGDMYETSAGSGVWRGGHNRWMFECNVADGSYVYIDDIEVYAQADNFTENGYTKGTFDTFEYAKYPVTESVLEGVTYEPYTMNNYKMTDDWSSSSAADKIPAEESVVISNSGEGVDGSYALKIVGEGTEKQFALSMGKEMINPSTEYMVKFKAKVSKKEALTGLNVGISSRWNWIGKVPLGISTAESGLIETNWYEYTTLLTTDTAGVGGYKYVFVDYTLATGEILYLDDIEVYEVDGDGVNLFGQGTFERINGVTAIDAGEEEGFFKAKYVNDYSSVDATTGEKNGFEAKPIATSLAVNGKHALAVGFNPDKEVNGRVWFELTGIDTGKTYKVKFSTLLVGEVTKLSIQMKDGLYATVGDIPASVELLNCKSIISTASGGAKLYKSLASAHWQTYEFYFTDQYSEENQFSWPGMAIFVQAAANAGVLIDDVSICEVSDIIEETPNLFESAGFEKKAIEAADFSSDKFYSNNDAADMSFMSDLPKNIGFYNASYNLNSDIFYDVLSEDSDFAYGNTIIIDASNLVLAEYEAEYAYKAGKQIWLAIDGIISSENAIVSDYQSKVTEAANLIQNIAGDSFQGFYFDEPHYHFESNDKFVEVTKYLRETFKKRVFAVIKHDSFTTTTAKVTVTEDSFKYVTDVGYWNYSISGMTDRVSKFSTNALPYINENARVWIASLMGTHDTYDSDGNLIESIDTEEETIRIFNTMLAGVKDDARFGGIMLYSLSDTNGYELHKLGEDGEAQYNNFRNLLLSVKAEFDGKSILEDAVNEDGVLVVDGSKTVGECADISVYADNSTVTVLDGGEDIGVDALLSKTGLTIGIGLLTSNETQEIKVAVLNDVNGDGEANLRDLVRMKKISSGEDASAEQLAAAGSNMATGIQATHLSNFRIFLVGR